MICGAEPVLTCARDRETRSPHDRKQAETESRRFERHDATRRQCVCQLAKIRQHQGRQRLRPSAAFTAKQDQRRFSWPRVWPAAEVGIRGDQHPIFCRGPIEDFFIGSVVKANIADVPGVVARMTQEFGKDLERARCRSAASWASGQRQRALPDRFGGKEQRFADVLRLEVRIEGEDALHGLPFGHQGDDGGHGNPEPTHAGDAGHLTCIDGDALEFHEGPL